MKLLHCTPPGVHIENLPVSGPLTDCVSALVAVEIEDAGPLTLAVAPHDSFVLNVQFGRGADGAEAQAELGQNTRLTGIRQWTGSFSGAGNCVSLFALLSPLGATRLLDSQPFEHLPRIRATLAAVLDRQLTSRLEADVARVPTLAGKLRCFAQWLEDRATARREQTRAALRAGRAAARLCRQPGTPIETLADEQHVSRRQLERDFAHWIGTSPRHLSQVARVQWVSRKAYRGARLADIAADVGFADQAHMSRVVRQLSGLTPRAFLRSQRSPVAGAFRIATGGGTVYL